MPPSAATAEVLGAMTMIALDALAEQPLHRVQGRAVVQAGRLAMETK